MGKGENNKPSPQTNSQLTQVDLGDDLVEKTRVVSSGESAETVAVPAAAPLSVDELLQNAKIYYAEGMIDDAKRILRRILISDPKNGSARQELQKIQEQELKRLLDADSAARVSRAAKPSKKKPQMTEAELIESLDRDLSLGILAGDVKPANAFKENLDRFLSDMEMAMAGSVGKDRIDLGIAYLEMDSPEVAIHHFKSARRFFESQEKPDPVQVQAAISLLAQAYLSSRKPLETLLLLQEAIKGGVCAEYFYLMGRACEALDKRDEAVLWFGKTKEIDGSYRDVEERLRRK